MIADLDLTRAIDQEERTYYILNFERGLPVRWMVILSAVFTWCC